MRQLNTSSTPQQPAANPPDPQSPPSWLDELSAPRLAAYKTAFKCSSDAELLGAYHWAQAIAASLHPFVGLIEVVLRNAIHKSLSLQCSGGTSQSFAWYDQAQPNTVHLKGKSLDKVNGALNDPRTKQPKHPQPSPDAVIAELSFGFWPNVLEGLDKRRASRTFHDVFKAHPHGNVRHWGFPSNRAPVVERFKKLQHLRNRICHHEPVWKLHWLGRHSGNRHWSASVQALRAMHTDMLELLSWVSPGAEAAYKASFAWNWFNRLCTTDSVSAFMAEQAGCAEIASAAPAAGVAPR